MCDLTICIRSSLQRKKALGSKGHQIFLLIGDRAKDLAYFGRKQYKEKGQKAKEPWDLREEGEKVMGERNRMLQRDVLKQTEQGNSQSSGVGCGIPGLFPSLNWQNGLDQVP